MSLTTDGTAVLAPRDLEEIAGWVWAAFLAGDGAAMTPLLSQAPLDAAAATLHAFVGVQGAWSGQVLLELTEATAVEVCQEMLQATEVTDADVTDAVGELVNMVGGNVKSLMSSPSSLGLPMVMHGTLTHRATHDVAELCRADLEWRGRPLRVSVWASTRTENENENEHGEHR